MLQLEPRPDQRRRHTRRKGDRWRWVAYLMVALASGLALYLIQDTRSDTAKALRQETADRASALAAKTSADDDRLRKETARNCVRIHRVVATLDKILSSGKAQTRKYVQEGLLTRAQARRANAYRNGQRAILARADCPRAGRTAP